MVAWIQSLVQELPYVSAAVKKKKKKEKKVKKRKKKKKGLVS